MPEAEVDYGKKIEYDPLWKGPMEIKRTKTDFSFIVSFGVFLLFWMGIAVYAYSTGDLNKTNNSVHNDFDLSESRKAYNYNNNDDDDVIKPYIAAKNTAIGFIIFGGLLSLVYIFLLRWYAKIIVYTALVTICALLFGVICFTSYLYAANPQKSDLLYGIIGSVIVFIVIVVFFLLFRKKIGIACEVIRESSKAVMFFPSSLLFPIFPALLYFISMIFAGTVLIYLSAIKYPNDDVPVHIYLFHCINVFGFLWLGSFITGFAQMTLSGTFATWYWSFDKKYIRNNTIIFFMHTISRYHLGTVAFGSLILAICQAINIILRNLRSRLQGNANPIACLFLGWHSFLFGNLERFLKYINRNAYVMSITHGTGFFQSAKDAFNLFMRNIVKVLVINKVTDSILFLGQLIVVVLSVSITYGWCHMQQFNEDTTSAAMILVLLGSILITVSVFMVLRTAVDTVFLCVVEDYERNDGSEEKPYFMSFPLRQLLLREQADF